MNRLRAIALSLTLIAAAPAGAVLAQDEQAEGAGGPSVAFEAARGPNVEQVPGGALMVGAYGVVFVLLLGYVVSLGFRQARIARDLARLRDDITARPEKEG